VAGAGGGGGIDSIGGDTLQSGANGGNAGSPGQPGPSTTGECGETLNGGLGGAAGNAGGAGGLGGTTSSCGTAGSQGSDGTAGAGGNAESGTPGAVTGGGGGGGGGYIGGGAGGGQAGDSMNWAGGGSGGGGSSYTGSATNTSVVVSGGSSPDDGANGEVIIYYPVLAVTTASLPAGTAGSAYSASLAAVNGTGPYTWSLAGGSALPSGLTLSPAGVISGAPAVGGTFSFTVLVSDSTSPALTAPQTLSLTINPATPQVEVSAMPASGSATVDTPVTVSVTVVGVIGVTTPSGSATFGGAAASCGMVTLVSGVASCSLGDLAAGGYSFTASYSGDTNYTPGLPGSLSGYVVSLLSQSVAFSTSPPSPAEVGGSYVPAASATSGLPVSLTVDSSSTAGACALSPSTGVVSFTGTGTCVIDANQPGNSTTYGAAQQVQQSFTIAPAATTTTVAVSPTALTATVTVSPPGGGVPSGMVTFAVDGTTVGTATLNASGVATLTYASSGAHTVAASYGGNADYLGSSGSTATRNPVITASLSSKHAKSAYGWYSSPVTVSFTCTAGSAALSGPCPAPVTLSRNGADEVVTRTIHGADGGIATVSVVVSIDQTKPRVTVTGVTSKAHYYAPGPAKISCKATEAISGLAGTCRLTVRRTAGAISWTATATSKAGISTTVHGRASLTDFYVAGVRLRDGRYLVTVSHTYTVIAYVPGASTAPKYVYAAPDGIKPHQVGPKMTRIGPGLYAIRTAITTQMDRRYENWTLGILEGHTLHLVRITLQR
jgi:hypothetical protein